MTPTNHVLLVVTGGIAAYKSCEVLRGLQKAGCELKVCMTSDAEKFIGRSTFEALTHAAVGTDLFSYEESFIPHIDLSDWADLILVCPATANILAKMAVGISDDFASTTLLAAKGSVLCAPAMNVRMWQNAATQNNVDILAGRGVRFVAPDEGLLACGVTGEGKLASVDEIVEAALVLLGDTHDKDLSGMRVLITAGPTHEAIDPVRFIANASSGKTGFALAQAAAKRGADVTLIAGPVSLKTPTGVNRVNVVSACEMRDAAVSAFKAADVAICAAAVADYMPVSSSDHKLKKGTEPLKSIALTETPDILAELSQDKGSRTVIGFAAETNNVLEHAQKKLLSKGCDMIVANDVSRKDSAFGSDTRKVTFITEAAVEEEPTRSLDALADAILNKIFELRRS